jgi:hypothetical protein
LILHGRVRVSKGPRRRWGGAPAKWVGGPRWGASARSRCRSAPDFGRQRRLRRTACRGAASRIFPQDVPVLTRPLDRPEWRDFLAAGGSRAARAATVFAGRCHARRNCWQGRDLITPAPAPTRRTPVSREQSPRTLQ